MKTIRFLDGPQLCRTCQRPCLTIRPGRRTRVPEHPLCARLDWDELLDGADPDVLRDAMRTVAQVFRTITVVPPPGPRRGQLGHCTRCHSITHRYGSFGQAWCLPCRKERP